MLIAASSPAELLPELTKRYRTARWSEFFGLAWFLKNASTDEELNKKISTLESIALIRHCQNDLVRDALPLIKSQNAPSFQKVAARIEKWVTLISENKMKVNTREANPTRGSLFSATDHLPFSPTGGRIETLDPLKIRKRIENLCVGGSYRE